MASISIVKTTSGKFRCQVRHPGLKSRSKTFRTERQANTWGEETKEEMESGKVSSDVLKRPLRALLDWYEEETKRTPKGRTSTAYLKEWREKHGDVPLRGLTPPWFVKWARDGAGPATNQGKLSTLGAAIALARDFGKLPADFAPTVAARPALEKLKLIGKSKERDRRPTPAELDALIEHFAGQEKAEIPMPEIIRFAVATGMRASEITRIRWADLNEAEKTVLIRDRKDPEEKIGNDQWVPLLDATGFDAWEIVQRQPRTAPEIFPYNAKTFSTIFPRACQAVGIEDLHFHDLRHEAISRLFEAGYGPQEVALVSGHRNWTTLRRYTQVKASSLHLGPAAVRASARAVPAGPASLAAA